MGRLAGTPRIADLIAFVDRRNDWEHDELRDELRYQFPNASADEIKLALKTINSPLREDVAVRASAPYVTARLLAERGFWTLTPGAQLSLFEFEDLGGTMEVVPSALGMPSVTEALVMNALVSKWADGSREDPTVSVSATELAGVLGLSMFGGLSERLARSVEILKTTSYRYVEQGNGSGSSDLFSLLDRVKTRWHGAPSSPRRRIEATFSAVVLEAIGNRRMIRPIDLDVIHALPRRDLARRLFLFLESSPGHREAGHRSAPGEDFIQRIIDDRLAGTLGWSGELRDLPRRITRAGALVETASAGRYRIHVERRTKRGLRPGDPRYLLKAHRAIT